MNTKQQLLLIFSLLMQFPILESKLTSSTSAMFLIFLILFFKRLLKNTKNILVFLLLIKWYHVHGFGLDHRSLIAMYAYLNNRVQATKVGSCYGKILDICFGIPQGSTFSPRFFYINIIDFVLTEHYRSFFTPYICGNTF